MGPLPLLREVVAVVDRAGRGVLLAVVEASAAGVAVAHVGGQAVGDLQVLSDGHVDLLGAIRVVGVAVDLRVGGLPVPGVRRIDNRERPVGAAEREELLQLGIGLLRIADHQRLASPAEPQVRIEARLVEVLVDLPGGFARLGVDHEGELRGVAALAADLLEDLAELQVLLAIGHGVGGVEDERIDAGVGQQVRVAAEHPRVRGEVVAVERLAPVVRRADLAPQRRIGLLDRFGVGLQDPRDVVGPLPIRAAVVALVEPEEVEDAHEPVGARRADLLGRGQLATQRIDRRPRYAGDGAGGRILGVSHRGGGEDDQQQQSDKARIPGEAQNQETSVGERSEAVHEHIEPEGGKVDWREVAFNAVPEASVQ